MTTPEGIESDHTLSTAVTRYDELRARDSLAPAGMSLDGEVSDATQLNRDEALELLALGEVISRKAGYGRQLTIRSARVAGASWSQIGAALGTSKQSAWEAHSRWIDQQAERHGRADYEGLDEPTAAAARALAGRADSEPA